VINWLKSLVARPALPAAAQRAFRYEQLTELTLPIAFTLLEGGLVGVIAAKIYQVSPAVLAVITAAPMFGNLSSFFWSRLANAKTKVRFATVVQALTMLCVLAIALAPVNALGAWLLVLGMVLSRLLIAGIITVRSVVWSLNYTRAVRARTTGRLQIITSLVTVVVSSAIGPLLDANPESFRYVYLAGAVFGLVGIYFFSRVNVIGESRQRVLERRASRSVVPAEQQGFFEILRRDRNYANYQLYQFTAGAANMIIEAPLVYLVTRELNASYTVSIALMMVIPFAVSMVTLPAWGNYLDRVHVAEFRARQSVLWIVSQALLWLGALYGSLVWIGISRLVLGIARGGGALAWQLGHNDFSDQQSLGAYMGVHVTLTGIRGATMPFLGMLLYVGIDAGGLQWQGLGEVLFLVAAALSVLSWWGFRRLHRAMSAQKHPD
jgi:MFS family permease